MMAYAQSSYILKEFTNATNIVNEIIVSYPDFQPA